MDTYPQWQSLPHTLVDPGEGVHEQNMPSSSNRDLLTFLVRYISKQTKIEDYLKLCTI